MNSNKDDLQAARNAYNEGISLLTKNCFLCRCSPHYYNAISPLKRSADLFHGLQHWVEEINSREELIQCFRATRSYWEEGNEYEKIAKIKLFQQDKPLESFNSIGNASNAYITGRNYEAGVKALAKAANDFNEKKYEEYSQKTLKLVFNSIIQFFHVLVLAKEEPHEYIYKALDDYLNDRFVNDKFDEGFKSIEQIIRTIDHDEDDKGKLVYYYAIGMIGAIFFDKPPVYEAFMAKAKDIQQKFTNNNECLILIEKANEIILLNKTNDNENKEFNTIINTLAYEFPTGIVNLLKQKAGQLINSIDTDEEFNFK